MTVLRSTINPASDEFKANATNEIFDTDGRLTETVCATAVGRRLESVAGAEIPQPLLSERSIP